MINKYPYTDFHELNLDWFLEEFKKVTDKVTTLDETVQQFTEFVTNYFDNLDVQQEINNKLDQMAEDGTLSALIQPLFDEYKAEIDREVGLQNEAIDVLEARMDTFASLPPGSTAGNAELLDIRVEIDGTTAASAGDAVRDQVTMLKNLIEGQGTQVTAATYLSVLPDADSAVNNHTYVLTFANGSTSIPANLPVSVFNTTSAALIGIGVTSASRVQIYIDELNIYYRRRLSAYAWDSWVILGDANLMKQGTQIISSNYSTLLPDADNAGVNRTYVLTFANGSTSIPANLPVSVFNTTSALLMAIGVTSVSRVQLYADETALYYRRKTGANTWGNWVMLAGDESNVFYVGSGRQYTTLKAGIEAATKRLNSILYVDPGTYDLVTEFGAAYFAAIDSSSNSKQGLQLKNNVHIIFASDSKVVCNYTGGNPYAHEKFSPFNAAGPYGYTLENLDLECSMVRYCVHDERSTSLDAYRNEYINCRMYCDNRNNTDWLSRQCIGGGLGESGEIYIHGCYFESEGSTANNGTVSYHNSSSANAKSRIVIENNYFGGNSSTVRLSWYGTSTKMTEALVSGNSFSAAPVLRAETPGSTTVNVSMLDWNNEVR